MEYYVFYFDIMKRKWCTSTQTFNKTDMEQEVARLKSMSYKVSICEKNNLIEIL